MTPSFAAPAGQSSSATVAKRGWLSETPTMMLLSEP